MFLYKKRRETPASAETGPPDLTSERIDEEKKYESTMAEIYHIAKGSISRKKMRLKEKIGITDSSFDEFVTGF